MKKCSSCGYFSINGGGFYKGQPHCKNKLSPKYNALVTPGKRCCDLHTEPEVIKAGKICDENAIDAVNAVSYIKSMRVLWAILDYECDHKRRSKVLVATITRLHKIQLINPK